MAVKLKTDITFQSIKVPTCYLSKESFMQCLGNETVTKSANANTANGINNVPMQLIEQKSSAESFGANVGNCSRDFHPGTDIEDAKALFEEMQETVQGTVGKYYALDNKADITIFCNNPHQVRSKSKNWKVK